MNEVDKAELRAGARERLQLRSPGQDLYKRFRSLTEARVCDWEIEDVRLSGIARIEPLDPMNPEGRKKVYARAAFYEEGRRRLGGDVEYERPLIPMPLHKARAKLFTVSDAEFCRLACEALASLTTLEGRRDFRKEFPVLTERKLRVLLDDAAQWL